MEIYSVLLLIALLAFAVGLVTELLPDKGGAVSNGVAAVALVAAAASLLVHVTAGHEPGTEDALGVLGFVTAHRALSSVLAGSAVLVLWQIWKRRRT